MRPTLLCLLAVLGLSCARAAVWENAFPRLFTTDAAWTTYGFKLLPQSSTHFAVPAVGELFRLEPSGKTPVLWRRVLLNLPNAVYIAPRGQVVTLDTYGGSVSGKHALVIYGLDGKVVLDLALSAFVRSEADRRCFSLGDAGLFLSRGLNPRFEYGGGRKAYLALRNARGIVLTFDLDTGKRGVPQAPLSAPLCPPQIPGAPRAQ